MSGILKISSGTKKIISIMIIVSLIAISIAYFYYQSVNKLEDPRIVPAKIMLKNYDQLMIDQKYSEVFPLLDSIEDIFSKVPCYSESFEMGVVYNNRGSAYLSMALCDPDSDKEKEQLLQFAKKNVLKSIELYENWISNNDEIKKENIILKIKPCFPEDDSVFINKNLTDIINKRAEDILLAKIETPRRLSVGYTNLGIIQRHQNKQEEALKSYEKAISLWKDNHTAKNNLNTLLGRPLEDISIIKKLFPKDRKKADN